MFWNIFEVAATLVLYFKTDRNVIQLMGKSFAANILVLLIMYYCDPVNSLAPRDIYQ